MDVFKPFGCPIYALDNHLQGGQKINKWYKRARLGIYLGLSPKHARSVALVLNLQTGMVSPQFHVTCENIYIQIIHNKLWGALLSRIPTWLLFKVVRSCVRILPDG